MKVVIVGGVAGGASAAARIRRLDEHAQIIIIERSGYVSYANCGLPYYVGGVIKEQAELTLQTPESFWDRFRIDVRVRQEVTAINPTEKTVTVRALDSGKIYTETYDKLLLAPGAKPTVPALSGVSSERVFTLRTVEDTLRIRRFVEEQKPKTAVLAGGGFIGLDVQMTSDGVVVVTHDSNLKRCTGKNAKVYDLSYAEVAQLDAGRWFSSRFADTRIPTLEQVLQLCRGRIGLNVEIKPSAATPALEAETVRLLREYGFDSSNCVITSQSYETLHKVKALAPEYPTGYILALGVATTTTCPMPTFSAWRPPLSPPAWSTPSICGARLCLPGPSTAKRSPPTCWSWAWTTSSPTSPTWCRICWPGTSRWMTA